MSFIRVNESLVDDLSYERGIVPSRVALCDDLLRFSLSSTDLSFFLFVGDVGSWNLFVDVSTSLF